MSGGGSRGGVAPFEQNIASVPQIIADKPILSALGHPSGLGRVKLGMMTSRNLLPCGGHHNNERHHIERFICISFQVF